MDEQEIIDAWRAETGSQATIDLQLEGHPYPIGERDVRRVAIPGTDDLLVELTDACSMLINLTRQSKRDNAPPHRK
jgi:hypothetical protein